ncbi:T-cell surface glycoprotein CD3 zeta chain isoform X2 [Pelobates fuscus]|uniref:T-cell surface glycoprotein CD3 zeta chain isoform X2 n=1 Tax=Pelobates fuscus TaxID=191477 RepID=UPI002FE48153
MKSKRIFASTVLLTQVLETDAQALGLTDPRLCYILDGILFLYAIIVTAMFFKEKFTQQVSPAKDQQESFYNDLNLADRAGYEEVKRRRDIEKGDRGQNRKGYDEVYTGLQPEKMNDPYSGIHIKPEKRKGKGNDGVYQGLSTATRDTYDALQMQKLYPR